MLAGLQLLPLFQRQPAFNSQPCHGGINGQTARLTPHLAVPSRQVEESEIGLATVQHSVPHTNRCADACPNCSLGISNCSLTLQVEEEFEIDLNDAEPDFLRGQTAKTGGKLAWFGWWAAWQLGAAGLALLEQRGKEAAASVWPSHQPWYATCWLLAVEMSPIKNAL